MECRDCERLKNACLAAAQRLSEAQLELARCQFPYDTIEFARLWNNCKEALAISVGLRDEIAGYLSPGEAGRVENQVFQCQRRKERLKAALDLLAEVVSARRDQRRPEPQFSPSAHALLRVLSPLMSETWPVTVTDVYGGGFGLLLEPPLNSGVLVQVRIGRSFVLAEVIHSRPATLYRFHVGVRVRDVV